jgi:hypothetical protein
MSNIHGLDFLRREHTLKDDGQPSEGANAVSNRLPQIERSSSWMGPDPDVLAAMVANKPDLEKQFDVIHFLQAHRSSGCLAPSVIYQRTGIDLQEDEAVAEMLQHNPKIRVELVPDPENPSLMIATYAYQAKYNHVRDRTSLLAQVNRSKNGLPRRDVEDAYDGVERDLDVLITAGDVLAINNTEDKTQIIFPRGEAFLVELDGIITILPERLLPQPSPSTTTKEEADSSANQTSLSEADKTVKSESDTDGTSAKKTESSPSKGGSHEQEPDKTSAKETNAVEGDTTSKEDENHSTITKPQKPKLYTLETDVDPRSQIRRGEAVHIGGQWFRVSSSVKEGPLKDQPARAQAPLSVVALQDLSKRNEIDGYIRPLSEKVLPVDHRLSNNAIEHIKKARQARERLVRLAHGRSGGVASQLLGSHAHASNPVTLAASFGTASMAGSRKRPHKTTTRDTTKEQHGQKDNAAQAREAASDPFLAMYTHARRHGCTKDVREMYLATRNDVPESDAELKQLLVEHKLLEPGEEMRRPRLKRKANLDNDGKPKKRRYYERKNQRMTNTHLEGTEIGAVLRRAQEKQKQGEQVGDGGM